MTGALETAVLVLGALYVTALALERIRAMWPLHFPDVDYVFNIMVILLAAGSWMAVTGSLGDEVELGAMLGIYLLATAGWALAHVMEKGHGYDRATREAEAEVNKANWDALVDAELEAEDEGDMGWSPEQIAVMRAEIDERLVQRTWRDSMIRWRWVLVVLAGLWAVGGAVVAVTDGTGEALRQVGLSMLILGPLWFLLPASSYLWHRSIYPKRIARLERDKLARRTGREKR